MKLFGKNPVIERLRVNPKSISKIYIEHGFKGTTYIHKKARPWGIPIYSVPRTKIQKMGRNTNTQGILVEVEAYKYVPYDEMLETAIKKNQTPVFLDGLNDPQNLGAMIRSLACLGRFCIVLPTHDSVGVTETVLRISSGGDNYVPVARVGNINNAIKSAKDAGFWIAGAVVDGGKDIVGIDLPHPMGIVIGSEQKGIRDVIRKNLDLEITIPMFSDTLSFNAAHAATILCYEITRQKTIYKRKQSESNA